jgi:hypothetical protein
MIACSRLFLTLLSDVGHRNHADTQGILIPVEILIR